MEEVAPSVLTCLTIIHTVLCDDPRVLIGVLHPLHNLKIYSILIADLVFIILVIRTKNA